MPVCTIPWPLVLAALGELRGSGYDACSGCVHDRTPVRWEDDGGSCSMVPVHTPCMTLVDRSIDPVLHLAYAIPFEDTEVPATEVEDSRTHQFFALCRARSSADFLPTWVTDDDVAAAQAKQLVEGVAAEDVLEHDAAWMGCWTRINADADRRPITCEMADAGVDWDTSMFAAGAYTIDGYTFEPVFNIWWPRPGVVKVHDGDPDAIGPAAAITSELRPVYRDEIVAVEGCVDALEGTRFTVSWALLTEDADPQWQELLPARNVEGDSFAFSFAPPMPSFGERGLLLRVDFEDPFARRYSTYPSDTLLVLDADHGASTSEGGASESGSSSGESTASESSESDTGIEHGTLPEADPSIAGGCGCGDEQSAATPSAVFVVLTVGAWRRRRSCSAS
jgi:uncharacterized protein (TIGR03382 family)